MRKLINIIEQSSYSSSDKYNKLSDHDKKFGDRSVLSSYLETLQENYSGEKIGTVNVGEFINGYIAAMLWSSVDDNGDPLDKQYSADNFSPESMEHIQADCKSFIHRCYPWLTEDRFKGARLGTLGERAGHDFWQTRCGYGAGFWDGDWAGEEIEGELTKAAHAYGNLDPYIGDDGKIHLM